MPLPFPRSFWALTLLLPLACKDPEVATTEVRSDSYQSKLAEGRAHLANGKAGAALKSFHAAAGLAPTKPEPLVFIAEASRQEGRYGAAILALKQAEALEAGNDPVIQKQLADLYRRDGHPAQAISTLVALREANQLTDPELLMLARLQARERDPDGAFQTLERIQRDRPDDVDAKLAEAEVLLIKGEEVLAARLMDRLVEQAPTLTAARLLRARYFLNSGFPEDAEKDLAKVAPGDEGKAEVVMLRARVLTAQERHAEAETMLTQAVDADPRNPDLLAQLGETKLLLAKYPEAQQLVDKVLRVRPHYGRALYVRARSLEAQGRIKDAEESYRYALTAEPGFAPVLSRMWRLDVKAGRKEQAVKALEQLFFMGEASADEKVALAELYAGSKSQLERAKKLIDEALARDPKNERFLAIRASIEKATVKPARPKGPSGPVIIRGGR